MQTTQTLWMANRDGGAALALAPLASAPSTLDLSGLEPVLSLASGEAVSLDRKGAEGIRRIAVGAGALSVFEVDGRGNVRRATTVGVRG